MYPLSYTLFNRLFNNAKIQLSFISLFLALSIFVLYFFRDPDIIIPENTDSLILAPAEGKIIVKSPVTEKEIETFNVPETSIKLSIFMTPLNVHVNRAPIAGELIKIQHHKGKKLPAYHEKASEENEHMDFCVKNNNLSINFRLIAGLVAQRIVSFKKEQDIVSAGDRVGMIKFGSRVDIIIPENYNILVNINDKVKAGGTILAEKNIP